MADLRPTARWDDLCQTQHDRAFVVAGSMKVDLGTAMQRAISEGSSLQEFRRDFLAAHAGGRALVEDEADD
jgi:hypothetical protein